MHYMQALIAYMKVQALARDLRERMLAKGWTQVAVSRATGVHQSQISRFRSGDFTEFSDNLWRVCEYAGMQLDEPVVRADDEELNALFDRLVANLDPPKRSALRRLLEGIIDLT